MDKQLLLIVEDRFDLWRSKQGLVVVPEVPMDAIPQLDNVKRLTLPVVLRFPDRTTRKVQAQFQFVHFNPGGFKKICSFHNLQKSELPIGTEIWLIY